MFLKSLEIYGFKSFADKVKLEFSSGITSLLGPNGCGKSNIVDAIKWVLGEQSTKTLRAGKMEDVIFNGTDARKPLQVAEVTLVLSNEERHLPVDTSEVEIKRRIFRTGESEYYLNRERVLLRNIRELFFDTGVGKSAYSIMEQGKIDQILSSRPEDRRYIFEEAAGISRFKAESIEAERKLLRTDENIAQVEAVLREVSRGYETKKNQAAKAATYRELRRRQFALEVDVQLSTLQSYMLLKESHTQGQAKAAREFEAMRADLSGFDSTIELLQNQQRERGAERIHLQTEIERLNESNKGKAEKLDLLSKRLQDFLLQKDHSQNAAATIMERIERDRNESDETAAQLQRGQEAIARLGEEIEKNEQAMELTRKTISRQNDEINTLEEENAALETQIDELAEVIRELGDVIVVQLEEKLSESGYNLKRKDAARSELFDKIEALRRSLKEEQRFLAQLASSDIAGSDLLKRSHSFHQASEEAVTAIEALVIGYEKMLPTFIDELIAPEGIISEKHRSDQKMVELRRSLTNNRDRVRYLREENERLNLDLGRYQETIGDQRVAQNQLQSQEGAFRQWIAKLQTSITEAEYQHKDALNQAQNAEERVWETQEDIRTVELEVEETRALIADHQRDLSALIQVIDALSAEIREKTDQKSSSFDRLQELRNARDKFGLQIEQLEESISDIFTNFFDTYGKSLKEYEGRLQEEIEELPIIRARLDDVRKEVNGMGYINQMAEDEFAEIKEQHDFLTKQLTDLMKAKEDLNEVVERIKTQSEELFLASWRQISQNFQQMFRRLFGGGRAELSLVDPDNVLESGIDILAQPPGKKLTHLTLLSGGERSMTAVALLFATYQVKPSPFCVLDEIDAALDDRNIGYFLAVLEEFARDSQFIIITHNKHTVMGSQTLMGVTQMEPGVSTMVGYKIGHQADGDVILDERGEAAVDFDKEGRRLSSS
ncbi:MAG: AAA family ATPase [Sphaerochaeta sp.]